MTCPDEDIFFRENSPDDGCPCLEHYFNDGKKKCTDCDTSCLTCDGRDKNKCLSCDEYEGRELIKVSYCGCVGDLYEDFGLSPSECIEAIYCSD